VINVQEKGHQQVILYVVEEILRNL